MIVKVVMVLGVVIAIVLFLATVKPKTFRIQRSITIDAPPDKVFALIDDFHNWVKWTPQEKEDSLTERSYSGPASGEGAATEWIGPGRAGSVRLQITESLRPTRISVQADWVKPFVARNSNEFVLEGVGTSTTVTWTMQGPNLYVMRVMSIVGNMDRIMGKHFERGLANLKAVAEQAPVKA